MLTNLKQFNPTSGCRIDSVTRWIKGKLRHLTLEDVDSKVSIDGLEYGFDKIKDKGIGDPDEYGYISRAVDSLFAHVQIEKPELIQASFQSCKWGNWPKNSKNGRSTFCLRSKRPLAYV